MGWTLHSLVALVVGVASCGVKKRWTACALVGLSLGVLTGARALGTGCVY